MKHSDENWLKKRYLDDNLTKKEIAKMNNSTYGSVRYWVRKYNFKKHGNTAWQKQVKKYCDKGWLYKKYHKERLSTVKIASLCNVSNMTIFYWLKKHKIKIRNKSEAQLGKRSNGWKGGKLNDHQGHVLIYKPGHKFANSHGYVYEHRLVAEKALGRPLRPNEVVHHVNCIPNDNRNSNLLICDSSYHRWLHNTMGHAYAKRYFK